MPPDSKVWGHIVLPLSVCPSICQSIRLSVCTNLTWKLNIFPLHLNLFVTRLIFGMKAHRLIHIFWYQGQGHLQRSRSNIRVMFLKRWVFLGHYCFTNTSCFFFKLLIPYIGFLDKCHTSIFITLILYC